MKKIVSLVMAVVMCLSIAVVGTTSASAKSTKSINYKGFYVKKKNFTGNSATSYFIRDKIYNVNKVFSTFLMDNTSIKKAKHIRKITCNRNNLQIFCNNFSVRRSHNDQNFKFENTGKTKISFSYMYKKKRLNTSINVYVYDNCMSFKVLKYSKHKNNYNLKFKVTNEIKPKTFYIKTKKGKVYLSKNKIFSVNKKVKSYNTSTTFTFYDKNGLPNTYVKVTMRNIYKTYAAKELIYAIPHKTINFTPWNIN